MKNMKIIVGIVLFVFLIYFGVSLVGNKKTETVTGATSQVTQKNYTASEVATHNNSDSCWFIFDQNVYDVTNYINQHPGGSDLVTAYCGKDATIAFNNKGGKGQHSPKAQQMLAQYLLGPVAK